MRLIDKYRGFSAQSTSRSTHHFLSSPLLGEKYGVTMGIATSCNYGKMISCDLILDRRQKIYLESEFFQTRNLITFSCFVSDGGTYEKSANETQIARSYLMEGRSRFCSSSMVPIDLHKRAVQCTKFMSIRDSKKSFIVCSFIYFTIDYFCDLNLSSLSYTIIILLLRRGFPCILIKIFRHYIYVG